MKKFKNFWFNDLSDKIRFLIIGGLNFVFAYLIFILCTFIFGNIHHQINLIMSWILSSFVSYATQRNLVFQSKGSIVKEYLKCLSTWMASYLVNAVLLEINIKVFNLNIFVAQFIAVGIAAVMTYFLFKYFALKNQ